MAFTVALTGGIGSGKSTVADAFSRLGVTVIDADIIAREVVKPGSSALAAIARHFGSDFVMPDGTLNRRRLRERIFAHPEDKQWLNTRLHPLIALRTREKIHEATSDYVLWVVPLLVENRLYTQANRVLVVDVSPQTQIVRTVARDGVSRQQAQQILDAQASRAERLAVADDIINNDDTPAHIDADVRRLHKLYLTLALQAAAQDNE